MGARVNTEDLNNEQLKRLVMIANKEIQIEKKMISEGNFEFELKKKIPIQDLHSQSLL